MRIQARMGIFLLVSAFLVGGPFYRQGLGYRSDVFRNWAMFTKYGVEICAVEYRERGEDGQERAIDRLAALGHERWWEAPRDVRRLRDLREVQEQGFKLCRAAEARDVRAYARCGHLKRGWEEVAAGEENLCERREKRER